MEAENVKVQWICAEKMIADCLTKKGVKTDKLMEVLENGGFDFKQNGRNEERAERETRNELNEKRGTRNEMNEERNEPELLKV